MKLFLVLGFFSFSAMAQVCTPEKWASAPVLREGRFMGTLVADCTITAPNGEIREVEEHFRKKVLDGVVTRHSGPVNDMRQSLPGSVWDVTAKDPDGTIRSTVFIGSDGRDTFIYDARSSDIKLAGLAGYLRKLDVTFTVTRQGPGKFNIKLTNTTHVAKPGLAPGSVFLNMAKNKALDQFRPQMVRLTQEITGIMK